MTSNFQFRKKKCHNWIHDCTEQAVPGSALQLSLKRASKKKSNVDTKIEITRFPHTSVVLLENSLSR